MSVTTKKPKPDRKSRSSYAPRRHDPRDSRSRRGGAHRPYPSSHYPPPHSPYGRAPYPPEYYYGKNVSS